MHSEIYMEHMHFTMSYILREFLLQLLPLNLTQPSIRLRAHFARIIIPFDAKRIK